MKAMILAAGKGTRVRPITYTIPKPMIPILQKPVMEFLLELLKQHGFNQVVANVSHLANEIEGYFRDGQRFGVELAYSFEGRITNGELVGDALGSAGGMRKIQDFSPFFDDTFVVLCGDALIDLDLTEAVRQHKEKGAIATIVMKSVPLKQVPSYGVVVTDDTGRIKSFQEKPTVEEALSTDINTGIYIFEPEIFKYIPSGQEFDIGGDLFPQLVEANEAFYGITMDFEWVDIGKVPDYWQAIQDVLTGQVKGVGIPGQEVKPGVYTGLNVQANWDKINIEGPVYIGGMAKIEDGATIIGPSMIGPNCCICSGALVDKSVIFEYSRIGPGVRLIDKLVFGRYCVDKTGAAIDLQAAALDWLITDARN
ncbi:MAG: NDP-sugar synthase, partial [Cyanobacteria bacterium J06628_4]